MILGLPHHSASNFQFVLEMDLLILPLNRLLSIPFDLEKKGEVSEKSYTAFKVNLLGVYFVLLVL